MELLFLSSICSLFCEDLLNRYDKVNVVSMLGSTKIPVPQSDFYIRHVLFLNLWMRIVDDMFLGRVVLPNQLTGAAYQKSVETLINYDLIMLTSSKFTHDLSTKSWRTLKTWMVDEFQRIHEPAKEGDLWPRQLDQFITGKEKNPIVTSSSYNKKKHQAIRVVLWFEYWNNCLDNAHPTKKQQL